MDNETRIKRTLLLGELWTFAGPASAAFKALFEHLPPGEVGEDEPLALGLDERAARLLIRRGDELYWLEAGSVVRERGGRRVYFRRGREYAGPPLPEN